MAIVNGLEYMRALHAKLKSVKDDYFFCRVSGIDYLEEVLQNQKRIRKFFAVSDPYSGNWFKSPSSTYYDKLMYSVFILEKCNYDDLDKRDEILEGIKPIFRSLRSKLIKDEKEGTLVGLNISRNPFYEVPPAFATGMAGMYFFFSIDNPVNLAYDADEWAES